MKIQELIDERLMEAQKKRETRESSHKWRPSLMGSCFRRHWYAKNGEKETNPPDARQLRVFHCGTIFHDFVQKFIPKEDTEVLIETDYFKGYADIIEEDCATDLKSIHSDGFWYMKKNVEVTLEDGKKHRVKEEEIKKDDHNEEYVMYYKKPRKVVSKRTITILEDKLNNWLQVGWYAKELRLPFAKLVFISKDDLCIEEYKMSMVELIDLVLAEEKKLIEITSLPYGEPRLYGGVETKKECDTYCSWKDKCKQDGNCIWTTKQ